MKLDLDEAKVAVETVKESADFGVFSIGPLPPNYGHTIGNTLRRVLLSSLPGAAISQVKFEGVPHQFTTIFGVKEDVVDLTLNLKQVRLKISGDQPVALTLSKTGPGKVVAGDIGVPAGVEIVNKDLHLATLADRKTRLSAELIAEPGRGYIPSEEREAKVGVIALDCVFSPVLLVSYKVEPTRVGRESGYDQLTMEITTDKTVKPREALLEASHILNRFFARIGKGEEKVAVIEEPREALTTRAKEVSLEELVLPIRLLNSLKKARIKTAADLLQKTDEQLLKIKNIGPASLKEIDRALKKEGLK